MSEKKNKGWNNLQPDKYSFANMPKDKLRAISRKGQARMVEVTQERRTAKQCLTDILGLEATESIIAGAELDPEIAEQLKGYADKITMYDLINLVAVGLAAGGNVRALEYVRDSVGDIPVKQISVEGANIMTNEDRTLLEHVAARLNDPDMLIVADVTAKETAGAISDKQTPAAGGEDTGEE